MATKRKSSFAFYASGTASQLWTKSPEAECCAGCGVEGKLIQCDQCKCWYSLDSCSCGLDPEHPKEYGERWEKDEVKSCFKCSRISAESQFAFSGEVSLIVFVIQPVVKHPNFPINFCSQLGSVVPELVPGGSIGLLTFHFSNDVELMQTFEKVATIIDDARRTQPGGLWSYETIKNCRLSRTFKTLLLFASHGEANYKHVDGDVPPSLLSSMQVGFQNDQVNMTPFVLFINALCAKLLRSKIDALVLSLCNVVQTNTEESVNAKVLQLFSRTVGTDIAVNLGDSQFELMLGDWIAFAVKMCKEKNVSFADVLEKCHRSECYLLFQKGERHPIAKRQVQIEEESSKRARFIEPPGDKFFKKRRAVINLESIDTLIEKFREAHEKVRQYRYSKDKLAARCDAAAYVREFIRRKKLEKVEVSQLNVAKLLDRNATCRSAVYQDAMVYCNLAQPGVLIWPGEPREGTRENDWFGKNSRGHLPIDLLRRKGSCF